MMSIPDLSKVVLATKFEGEDVEETRLAGVSIAAARSYISGFRWCSKIVEQYVGLLFPGVLGVSLFEIVPARNAPPWVWIITGDLPPAYLNVDPNVTPNAANALDCYVGHMRAWVDAIRDQKSLEGLMPVAAEPTIANANLLDSRLDMIDSFILSQYVDELLSHGRWRGVYGN